MKKVTTYEAKTHLSSILKELEAGEQVVIYRGNVPVAELKPVKAVLKKNRPRVGEITSDHIRYTEDAFSPLTDEELKEWGI